MTIDGHQSSVTAGLKVLLNIAGAASRGWLFLAVVGSLVLALLDALGVAAMVPLMELINGNSLDTGTLRIISRVLDTRDTQLLLLVVAAMIAGAFVLKSAFTIAFRWWLLGRTTRISADAAAEILRRYVLEPYVVHRTRSLPEIYRNVNDATAQAASVLLGVVGLGSDILMLVFILVVLLAISPVVTVLAAIFFGALISGVQVTMRRRQRRTGEELAKAALDSWQYLLPSLNGFREARLASAGGIFVRGFHRAKLRAAHQSRVLSIVSELPKYLLEIGFVVAIAGIAGVLFATTDYADALGVLGVFAAASLRALPTLNRVSATFAIIRSGQAGLGIVVDAVRETGVHLQHDELPTTEIVYGGDLEIDDLHFRYPDATEDVLRGITAAIPENTTAAFVGTSGAGKSTLLDTLLGLLQPTTGAVKCGGLPILADPAGWISCLGVVPQDVFLLNDTIEANVAFGQSTDAIDRVRVEEVVRQSQLSGLINDLPEGLSTVVGERGVRLSGGQRQRIGLARALYRRPKILILDEATSSLDNETEHEIARTLESLRGSMTVIVVAHRLSTVRDVDQLYFMENGQIVARGTFEDVRDSSQAFAKLVALGDLG